MDICDPPSKYVLYICLCCKDASSYVLNVGHCESNGLSAVPTEELSVLHEMSIHELCIGSEAEITALQLLSVL